jgi:hypothetical protein
MMEQGTLFAAGTAINFEPAVAPYPSIDDHKLVTVLLLAAHFEQAGSEA